MRIQNLHQENLRIKECFLTFFVRCTGAKTYSKQKPQKCNDSVKRDQRIKQFVRFLQMRPGFKKYIPLGPHEK